MIAYDGVVSRGPEKSCLGPWWGHAGRFLTMSHPLDSLSDAAYRHLVEPIWNFLVISHVPAPSDVIFVFGSQDLAVPRRAAEFFSDGLAPCLLVTGGFGPMTEGVFPKPEALVFKDELIRLGVPGNAIVTEATGINQLLEVYFFFLAQLSDTLGHLKFLLKTEAVITYVTWGHGMTPADRFAGDLESDGKFFAVFGTGRPTSFQDVAEAAFRQFGLFSQFLQAKTGLSKK